MKHFMRIITILLVSYFLLVATPTAFGQTAAADQPSVLWQVQTEIGLDTTGGRPTGLAVAPDGTLYVADVQRGLRRFSPDGKELPPLDHVSGDVVSPSDVVVTAKNIVYLTLSDRPEGTIARVEPDQLTLLNGARFNLGSPRSIAVNAKGELFALDVRKLVEQPMDQVSIMEYDADGKYVGKFVALTAAQLQGVGVVRIAAAPVGGVFVVTDSPQGIYAFSYDGKLIKQGVGDQPITALKPTALGFGPDEQTAVGGKAGQIMYNSGKSAPTLFGSKAGKQGTMQSGTFYAPIALAVGAADRVYVLDQNEDHAQIVAIQFPTSQPKSQK